LQKARASKLEARGREKANSENMTKMMLSSLNKQYVKQAYIKEEIPQLHII